MRVQGGQQEIRFLGPFARAHVTASTSQPWEPNCLLARADAVPSRCRQQNCQPRSQSVFILLAPGAAEQLVRGIGAMIRSVFFFRLTTQFLKTVCLVVSNPSLLKFLVLWFSHLLRLMGPEGSTAPRADGHG